MNSEIVVNGIELRSTWLGEIDYRTALDIQRSLLDNRKAGLIPDSVLFLEHSHVVTLGRRADDTHLVTERSKLLAAGVEIFETDRGGEATSTVLVNWSDIRSSMYVWRSWDHLLTCEC